MQEGGENYAEADTVRSYVNVPHGSPPPGQDDEPHDYEYPDIEMDDDLYENPDSKPAKMSAAAPPVASRNPSASALPGMIMPMPPDTPRRRVDLAVEPAAAPLPA